MSGASASDFSGFEGGFQPGVINDVNPMGTDGFEFVEYTAADTEALDALEPEATAALHPRTLRALGVAPGERLVLDAPFV